jgi:response regulator RpfG family c-di-GMP phosphodiesterase
MQGGAERHNIGLCTERDAHYLLWRLRTTPATAGIPVIVMTAAPLDEVTEANLRREVCGRPGAVRFLRKSFDTKELSQRCKNIAPSRSTRTHRKSCMRDQNEPPLAVRQPFLSSLTSEGRNRR